MRKLPEGEAKRRHDERNRLKNKKRKADRIQRLIAEGRYNEDKKARKLELQRQRRKVNSKPKLVKVKPAKLQRVKIKPIKELQPRKQKKVIKVETIPTRIINLSACLKIRLDEKTTIYVKQGSDVHAIRERFLNR